MSRLPIILLACLISAISGPAHAESADDALLAYAVAILQTPGNNRSGAGIYIGKGLVLTAAHVVGGGILNKPKVTIAGRDVPATVVKQGTFESTDLSLLEISEEQVPASLRGRRVSLCKARPWPGEEVVTVVPEGTVRSHVLSPVWLPLNVRKFNTVISDVAQTGNSGSGVFDAQKQCLLGIMSRKISQTGTQKNTGVNFTSDVAKYFVPASTIADFMPTGMGLDRE
jgi:S1-C subfamily serine protease